MKLYDDEFKRIARENALLAKRLDELTLASRSVSRDSLPSPNARPFPNVISRGEGARILRDLSTTRPFKPVATFKDAAASLLFDLPPRSNRPLDVLLLDGPFDEPEHLEPGDCWTCAKTEGCVVVVKLRKRAKTITRISVASAKRSWESSAYTYEVYRDPLRKVACTVTPANGSVHLCEVDLVDVDRLTFAFPPLACVYRLGAHP